MITTTLYTGKTIAAGATVTCPRVINLRQAEYGIFTLQLVLTGDGTLIIEYLLSHDGIHFVTPATSSAIVKDFDKTSGPGSDGIDLLPFDLELAPDLKLKFEETGTTDSVVITAIVATH